MSIFTNRLKIDFHIDAIERDFVFIRLKREKNGNWWGAEELDRIIGDDYKAMSVGYAQYAYAMFEKKSNNTNQLLQKLRTDPKFGDVAAIEVTPEAVYKGNDECICGVTLARLLMNSLGSSRSRFKQRHFSNLTGALLKVPSLTNKLNDVIPVAEIALSPADSKKNEFLLNISVVSYRKKVSILKEDRGTKSKKIPKRPEYVFHSGTASLRRWLPSDGKDPDATKTYIKRGKAGTKLHTNFLEFKTIKDFENSRAGILQQVFQNIQDHLSEYMRVDFSPLEIDHSIELKKTLLKKPKELHSKLDGQPINIVDTVNDEDSADLVIKLKESLRPYITNEKLITDGKGDKQGALNFRIIHDADFYEQKEQKDEYLPSTDKFQRQHLTIESSRNISDAIVKTIIKEQLIKRDISTRKLNLFEWDKLQLSGVWTFAAWDEDENDEDENHVIFMEIQPNGDFEFHQIKGQDIFNWQKFKTYQNSMTDSSSGAKLRNLEGLVICDTGDINQIFRTNEITIPDLSKIETILKEVETELPENQRSGNALADIVEDFLQEESKLDIEKFKSFSSELRKVGREPISKADFKSLIAQYLGTKRKVGDKYIDVSTTREATNFRDYLLEKHQIRLKLPQDNQSKDDLFDASLNIKYFGETEKEAYYFVGDRREKVQFSFKDACHLRKIVAVDDSKLIFTQLLPTMDVDFVRTGQSTVIPFPFKYIREYQNFGVAK
ncbi:hypothetical protein [Anabaena sp. CCY 0017]|uniref:hypothetical protein n=1 Tax=Anabaena sp. CCY 0017 TaxID=3103866 RepID=UPI0039C68573